MRIQSMGDFSDKGQYHVPESIGEDDAALEIYCGAMDDIQTSYAALVALGIPMEDARNLIPLGATHRIAMSVNLQALRHIIGNRGCWILQASLWAPVIKSMVDELATKVHPAFRRMVFPPCIEQGAFKACKYHEENIRRVDGRDALPVCPLYARNHMDALGLSVEQVAATQTRIPEYADLWGQPGLAVDWDWAPR